MTIIKDFAGKAKQVEGDPVVIVALRDGKYDVIAMKDGRLDATYRPAKTLDEVATMLHQTFILDRND